MRACISVRVCVRAPVRCAVGLLTPKVKSKLRESPEHGSSGRIGFARPLNTSVSGMSKSLISRLNTLFSMGRKIRLTDPAPLMFWYFEKKNIYLSLNK